MQQFYHSLYPLDIDDGCFGQKYPEP
ncbi:hypothetical protein CY0110_16242 [Crocosphaera chwakensis CCY0110]|uniref:Uncharacterized protein n=1 Tax=Crocosphaera chwakensis CCY0110 TaxID=391612 RepID=A3IHT0_9CHRO|nr:hypothetical protein CY0110_16242 [Crocosphaera chwakensis CCY0110]